jgi:hypothetical protein
MGAQVQREGKEQMQNYSTNEIANGAEFPGTGAPPDVNPTVGPSELTAPTSAGPALTPSADELTTGPGAEAPATPSNNAASAGASTNSVTSHSQSFSSKPVTKVKVIKELARNSDYTSTYWKPPFEVPEGCESSIEAIVRRTALVRSPLAAIPLPNDSAPYGTTDELFGRLKNAIAAQASVSAQTSALLSYWTLSTWFSDGLSLTPGLVIVGPAHEGGLVLRALRNFCHYPLMLTRADIPSMERANWNTTPTLLLYAPNISKQMVTNLGCSSARGYMINSGGRYKDFYGPKGIYLGEEVPVDRIPRCSLQVRLLPTAPAFAMHQSPLTEATVQDLQNQLQEYRCKNLVRVNNSNFDASLLTSDTRAIANALGACVIDSPGLQSQLISFLTPVEYQREADRSTCLEAVMLEATLNLCHQGKAKIMVGEIATEFNQIGHARGERLVYSATKIGHPLKKVGLATRRLGKAGKGLLMDLATIKQVHDLAAAYGVGLGQDENNLHCPLCTENKRVM